jgi:hypothetical protein
MAQHCPSCTCGSADLVFPCVGTGAVKSWTLTPAQVAEWSVAFPGIDVTAECRKAHAWIKANPTRAKTPRGMPAYLVRWLTRAQEVRPTKGGPALRPAGPNPSIAAEVATTNVRLQALRAEAAKPMPTADELRKMREEMRGVVSALASAKS